MKNVKRIIIIFFLCISLASCDGAGGGNSQNAAGNGLMPENLTAVAPESQNDINNNFQPVSMDESAGLSDNSATLRGSAGNDVVSVNNKKNVIFLQHGTSSTPTNYSGLINAFISAGFKVFAPNDSNPFAGNQIISEYNSLKAQNSSSFNLDRIILVGHSAGAAGAEIAAQKLGKVVAGVVCIDGVSTTATNKYAKYAYFRHSMDNHGKKVGNISPNVPKANVIIHKMLPGLHITAMSGSDASNYIQAINEMLN